MEQIGKAAGSLLRPEVRSGAVAMMRNNADVNQKSPTESDSPS